MAGPVCVRHPGRETGVRCTRCDRPACPACLREASIGYHCVDCVAEDARSRPRTSTWAAPTGSSPVIPVLIAINVAVFAFTVVQAGSLSSNADAPLFAQWALQPAAVAQGAWWQLLTSGFLHIGPLHLAFNMIALWVIGRDLERALGQVRFLVVYLVSLLGGSLVVYLFANPMSNTAGASGAVFGLMGGLAVVLMRLRLSPRPALTIIVLNVIISFAVPNISILGHLGGLAFGAALTAAMLYAPKRR
ncbi:MAG: rhomboid family intramembrane serine protease [Pseudonocardiaceae bacterium]